MSRASVMHRIESLRINIDGGATTLLAVATMSTAVAGVIMAVGRLAIMLVWMSMVTSIDALN